MKYIRKYQQGDLFGGLNNLVGLATYSVPPDASGHVSDMNCIGSACMALKKAGVDIPIIPGNSNFWDQAQRGQIPVKVYITRADERASRLNKIQKGDIMGHDRPGKRSRNKYFPEHSNIVYDVLRDADGKITTVRTLDGYGDKFSIKDYSYDELEKGGPYGNLFVGRPTSINGKLNPADFSVRSKTRDVPENLNETISNTWYNLDPDKTAGLSNYQTNTALNIAKIGSNLKKDFITKTGISNDKYDKLVQMLVGVSGQESNYGVTATKEGNNVLKYGLKNRLRTDYENVKDSLAKVFVKEGPSRGVLQVKDRNIFKNPGTNKLVSEFGITKHNYNPDDLKQNVVMALALLNNIDLHQLPGFNSPKTKKMKEFKGRKNNWLARRAASNYVQTEYTTHNDPDLPYEQKMLYYYNRPRTVKRGDAQGDNIYIKNVIEGSKLIYPQKSSLITLPVVNIIGAKTNAINTTNATTDEFDFGPQPYAYQSGGVLSDPTIRGKKYPAGTVVTNDPKQFQLHQDSVALYNNAMDIKKRLGNNYTFSSSPSLVRNSQLAKIIKGGFSSKQEQDAELERTVKDNWNPDKMWEEVYKQPKLFNPQKINDNMIKVDDLNSMVKYPYNAQQLIHKVIKPKSIDVGISKNNLLKQATAYKSGFDPNIDYKKANAIFKNELGIEPFTNEQEWEDYKQNGNGISKINRINPLKGDNTVFTDNYPIWDYTNVKPKVNMVYEPKEDIPVSNIVESKKPAIYTPKRISNSLGRMTPKGMPVPTVTPNQGIRPDVIYTERPDGHRKQGLSISHRTDPLGRWAADIHSTSYPGIKGRLTSFPNGTHKTTYKYQGGGWLPKIW